MQIVGEIGRRPRLVRAMHGRDLRVGQVDAGVVRLDGRIVPGRDLALEDLRGRLRGRAAGCRRPAGCRRSRAARCSSGSRPARRPRFEQRCVAFGSSVAVERRVAAGEGGLAARDELIAAAARADRVIGDGRARVLVLELRDPRLLGGLLGARPRTGDGAGGAAGRAAVCSSRRRRRSEPGRPRRLKRATTSCSLSRSFFVSKGAGGSTARLPRILYRRRTLSAGRAQLVTFVWRSCEKGCKSAVISPAARHFALRPAARTGSRCRCGCG